MNAKAVRKISDSWPLQEAASIPTDSEKVNILVVDDLPEKLLVYRTILEELGQNLMTVSSGEEALKMVLQHEFAVILLDVNMPGMDGFETASLIRQRKKSARTPIIFLTAFVDEMRAAQGYASGAVDYLPTPVVPEVLQAKVRVFIELSLMRRQAALQAEESARRAAAEESTRRLAFLAKFSEHLARSQTRAEIMRVLVEQPIPYLADVSIVWLANEEGPGQVEWTWKGRETGYEPPPFPVPVLPWLEKIIHHVSKAGQLQILDKLPLPEPASEQLSVLPFLGEAIALPLSVRGQIHGVLVLAHKRSQSPYQSDDISLASDLASRASVALENVTLIERIQEADRRKDEFLGMLAHELRNPLGPIRNAVQLLQMMGPQEPRMVQLRDIVDRQVGHMTRLIDDLLDARRLANGKILLRKERCDLVQIARQTVEDYRSIFDDKNILLENHVTDTPLWVEGDPTRLVQAVGNLLHNAHKFTDPGGHVTVRLGHDEAKRAAVITVSDNGIGIDAKILPHVFDMFCQAEQGLDRSRGGLGLGLALVKGLVRLHNGDVSVVSDGTGKGASFTIRLPMTSMPAVITSSTIPAIPESEKYRILVIEDNKDTAESARMLLTLEGYDVQTAYNGSSGLEMARLFQPQVILCDIGLPGMDGYQIARTIRQDVSLSSAYVIALTGYGRDEDQRQAHEAGFDLHLTKPIDYNNLCRALACLPARSNFQ